MCGIFGLFLNSQSGIPFETIRGTTDRLFQLSESRGKEAAGIAISIDRKVYVKKQPLRASRFIKTTEYDGLFKEVRQHFHKTKENTTALALIGHTRLATNGAFSNNQNNQPVVTKKIIGVHNGIIVNDESLWESFPSLKRRYAVDTEILLRLLGRFYEKTKSLKESIASVFDLIEGSASIALFFRATNQAVLATNTGSLYVAKQEGKICLFASEEYILKEAMKDKSLHLEKVKVTSLESGNALLIDLERYSMEPFKMAVKQQLPKSLEEYKKAGIQVKVAVNTRFWSAFEELQEQKAKTITKVFRCTRCLLPETMPLIEFDEEGICNYCHAYQKLKVKGEEALRNILCGKHKHQKQHNCILAFSGGRDSAYALHHLKKVMGLNPIAYTYDWGMVTDLARRNQARLVGKLGVEHIIVSADIKKKRGNIRKNVKAWLKQPDLGMVPLFMAGDKQAEYYAMKLREKTGLGTVVYARGNQLENEEFKWGYCGVKNGSPKGVIHNLSWLGKLKLAGYYAKQFITNPAYFNSSLIDSAFAYYATYIMPTAFIYLWHYIEWDEATILTTLRNEYAWETAKDTVATWRTDDASVPFYNYIYYTVQGFTENDTLRSNQIREGKLTREDALQVVIQENKPRTESLKWYFEHIGIDAKRAIETIEAIPKRYEMINNAAIGQTPEPSVIPLPQLSPLLERKVFKIG